MTAAERAKALLCSNRSESAIETNAQSKGWDLRRGKPHKWATQTLVGAADLVNRNDGRYGGNA